MNKNYLLGVAHYKDKGKQDFFDNITSKIFKEYCEIHNFEYLEITEELEPVRGGLHWVKTYKVEEVLNNVLNDGDGLIIIDADALIIQKNKNLLPPYGKSFAYSIDTGNTHCFGFLSIIKNDWTINLFKLLHSQERYDALIDRVSFHEGKKTYSSHWKEFNEQASWYSLAGIKRHSNEPFWNLPDNGWHSDVTEWTVYSLEELRENVHIFPSEYNVTELPGESSCQYYINKVKYKDVVIRHFAGGQKWRKVWMDLNSPYFKLQKINFFKFIRFYKFKLFLQKLKGYILSKINSFFKTS
tara:strand:- start:3191 stop:4084 length:894 start_codon:yes stop_codon:yes gene_type:complete